MTRATLTRPTVEKLESVPADYYRAGSRPRLAAFGPIRYLFFDGTGAPGGEAFEAGVQAIYSVAYTLKFAGKPAGRDFKVGALEGLWWTPGGDGPPAPGSAREAWRWKLLIALPESIADADIESARTAAAKKRGCCSASVGVETIDEGEVVQALHTGPYASEPETVTAMRAFATGLGRRPHGHHHEIYLSDPRRVAPERMRTILRQPVEPAD